jgi:hypothetical protein
VLNDKRTFIVGLSDDAGKKTVFLSHLYIKIIILPRQARDKHRETTQKGTVLLQARALMKALRGETAAPPATPTTRGRTLLRHGRCSVSL